MSTITKLTAILAEELNIPASEIRPESLIRQDLGSDSFDDMQILMAVEEEFGISINDSEFESSLATVQVLADLIDSKISAKPHGSSGPAESRDAPAAPQPRVGKYNHTDPRAKLKPGEPWFFLRAQDVHAPAAVRSYASVLASSGDTRGGRECFAIADAMTEWQRENPAQVKRPD